MTLEEHTNKEQEEYVPYSTWSKSILEVITSLTDECLDRFKEDKKTNKELLRMLSKLSALVEKKYSSRD